MPEAVVPFRRSFPWEIVLLVVNEADRSTLALLGRVSYDFLATAAPLLYRSVQVSSGDQLERLFCEREEAKVSPPSRINDLLSLSQIRSLSIDLPSVPSAWIPHSLRLSFSRLDGLVDSLLLDHFKVQITEAQVLTYRVLHAILFPRLNPLRFIYSLLGNEDEDSIFWLQLSRAYQTLDSWTRTEDLQFVGGVVYLTPLDGPLLLGSISQPSLDRRRIVRIQVDLDVVASVLNRLRRGRSFGFEGMQDGTMRLVVKSEEEKVAVEEALRASKDIERWRRVFAVEVDTR